MAQGASDFLKKTANVKSTGNGKPAKKVDTIPGLETTVDTVIKLKTQLADMEAKFRLAEAKLLEEAKKEYEKNGVAGSYKSSFVYDGKDTNGAMVIFSDKFSAIPSDMESELRKLDPNYDEHFGERRVLKLRDTSDAMINKLRKALGDTAFAESFEIKVDIEVKDGVARNMFSFAPEVRANLNQTKPSVRNITADKKVG